MSSSSRKIARCLIRTGMSRTAYAMASWMLLLRYVLLSFAPSLSARPALHFYSLRPLEESSP